MIQDCFDLLLEANSEAPFVSVIDEEYVKSFISTEDVIKNVWYRDNKPVALYLATASNDWCEPVYKLFELVTYIIPEYRNKEIAKSVALYAENTAKELGVQEVIAGVTLDINKEQANKFYESRGFSAFGKTYKKRF